MKRSSVLWLAFLVGAAASAQARPPKNLRWAFEAMTNPAKVAEGDAGIVLLDDVRVQPLNKVGKIRLESRFLFKVLSSEGLTEQFQPIYYDKDGRLEWYRAWTIRPDGSAQEVDKSRVSDRGLSTYDDFSDIRAVVLPMPNVGVGSFVAIEHAIIRPAEAPHWIFQLQGHYPVALSRRVLELADDWDYRAVFHHMDSVEPRKDGNHLVWEFRDLPGLKAHESSASPQDAAATLALSYFPRSDGAELSEWPEVASWADALYERQASADTPMRQTVTELISGTDDPLAKIEAIGRYVQELRYIHISMGRSGYVPYPATDVFSRRYGDCKDKATLMLTMLREAGITSHPLLVNTRDEGQVFPSFPSPRQFNHVILAIPVHSENASLATTTHPELGALLVFDPTDDRTPVGDLPWTDQGIRGLLVHPEHGSLVDLPILPAESNRAERDWELRIEIDGSASAKMEGLFTGQYARLMRGWLAGQDEAERKKALAAVLARKVAGTRLVNVAFRDLLSIDEPVGLSVELEVPRFSRSAGPLRLAEPFRFATTLAPTLPEDPGGLPALFRFPFRETDRVHVQLPEHWRVSEPPESRVLEAAVGRLSLETTQSDTGWELKRDLVFEALGASLEDYDEAREFLGQVLRSATTRLILERENL